MTRKWLFNTAIFFADPVRVRLVLCTLVLALALLGLFLPAAHALADDIPGGSH